MNYSNLTLSFNIETLGSISAEIISKDLNFKVFHSSEYGDGFQELLNDFFYVFKIIEEKDEEKFPFSSKIIWNDDFVNYEWDLYIENHTSDIKILIFEFYPFNQSGKNTLIETFFSSENLKEFIFLSLEKILNDFGFIGYKLNWEIGNFPIYEFLTLKAKKLNLDLNIGDRYIDDWKLKTKLELELSLIK